MTSVCKEAQKLEPCAPLGVWGAGCKTGGAPVENVMAGLHKNLRKTTVHIVPCNPRIAV